MRDAAEPVVVALIDGVGEGEKLLESGGGKGGRGKVEFGQGVGQVGRGDGFGERLGAEVGGDEDAGDLFSLNGPRPADDVAAEAMSGEPIPKGGLATGVERGGRKQAVAIGVDARGNGGPNGKRERRMGRDGPAQGALPDQAPQVRELSAIEERTEQSPFGGSPADEQNAG
jgi:hypothetical protein